MSTSKKKFKTEVQQLLDIVIHSLYTRKEIFLRELISNASDAIDRGRYESLKDDSVLEDDPNWKIKLIPDKATRTLTIRDNGIGMTKDEVEANIGTIASSGTRRFIDEMKQNKDASPIELIGQFGVGFYSAFMVAEKVEVLTRRAGDKAAGVHWESTGDGTYIIADAEKESRGTDVIMHLREDETEFLEEWRLRKIIQTYSDFVAYPIAMDITRKEQPLDEDGKPDEDAEAIETVSEETLNSMKAIWKRTKSEITEDEYQEFYRHISHNFDKPLETIHFKAEGVNEFSSLLFIPSSAPWNILSREEHKGLHLYVKNVFISDDCKDLLPEYLRFVAGVVDSSDLPLNVSRETLQDHVIVQRIRKSLVGKILGALADLKEKKYEKYVEFWKELGKVVKEGIHFDYANKEKLQELLLFRSSTTEKDDFVSLKQYVDRMPSTQKEIYFITGDSRDVVANSPYLEAFNKRGYEVLFLTDPIDEWVVQSLNEYQEKKLTPINQGEIELDSEEEKEEKKEEREKQKDEYKELLDYIQKQLDEQVKEVRISSRLTDSACCLVADKQGMNAHMERLFRAANQDFVPGKRILEINPTHQVFGVMKELHGKDAENDRLKDYVELLYDQALLNEGSPVRNPLRFTRLISSLMVKAGE